MMGRTKPAGRIWAVAMLLPLFLLPGCEQYPGVDDENTAQLIAFTNWQKDIDFTQYRTFRISEWMGVVTADGKTEKVKNQLSGLIRSQTIACMQAAGYTLLNPIYPAEEDLFLSMVEVEQVNISVGYDPFYFFWGSYDPWGWGYYYRPPYYPVPYVSSAYATQTVSIQIGDRKNKQTNEEGKEVTPVIWNAYMKGISGYDRSDEEIRNIVSECFTQTDCAPFKQNTL